MQFGRLSYVFITRSFLAWNSHVSQILLTLFSSLSYFWVVPGVLFAYVAVTIPASYRRSNVALSHHVVPTAGICNKTRWSWQVWSVLFSTVAWRAVDWRRWSSGRVRRRYTGSVRCRRVATVALKELHSWHTHDLQPPTHPRRHLHITIDENTRFFYIFLFLSRFWRVALYQNSWAER